MAVFTPTVTWTVSSGRHSHPVFFSRHAQTPRSACHDAIFKSTYSALAFSGAAAFAGLGAKTVRRRVDMLGKEEHLTFATGTLICPSHRQPRCLTAEPHGSHCRSAIPACSSSRSKVGNPRQAPLQAHIVAEQLAIVTERALEAERKAQDLVQEVARERARASRAAAARDAAQVEAEQFRSQHVLAERRACSLRDELLSMEELNREQRAKMQKETREAALADESRRLEGLEVEARRLEARAVQAERRNTELESQLKDRSLALLEVQQNMDLTEDKVSGLLALSEETKVAAARRIETLEQQVAEARAMKNQAEAALVDEQVKSNSLAKNLEQNLQANSEQDKRYQDQIAAAVAKQEEYKEQMTAALAKSKEVDMQLRATRLELLDLQQRLSDAEDAVQMQIGANTPPEEKATSVTTTMEPASQTSEQVVVPSCEAHEVPSAGRESPHDVATRSEAASSDTKLLREMIVSSEVPAVEIKAPNDKAEAKETPSTQVPLAHDEVPAAGVEVPHEQTEKDEEASEETPSAEVPLAHDEVQAAGVELPHKETEREEEATEETPSAEVPLAHDEVPAAGAELPHAETENEEEATETAASKVSSNEGMTQESLDEAARLKAVIADMEQTLREEAGFSDEDILSDPDVSVHREALERLRLDNLPSYHRWAMEQGIWQPRTEKEAISMRKRRKMLQRKGMLGPCIANQDKGKRQKGERQQRKEWIKTKRKQVLVAKRRARDSEFGQPGNLDSACTEMIEDA
eukprot:TRINITY_DN30073_c0_g1_i1.p1 TRINITY_DN30073_c0_g1~~TRINITY_DN30073_c0_g1_i1.p1  ORF type:complete len:751 (+),score=189.76 TRINITY_DN30073_c0_g1_i1:36-2288(+)